MRVIEKMKEKIKNDERFIAKMILTGVLTVSLPAIAGGIITCHNAVKDNPDSYTEDSSYIAGVVSVTVGSTILSAGVAGSIDTSSDENHQKKYEDDLLQK